MHLASRRKGAHVPFSAKLNGVALEACWLGSLNGSISAYTLGTFPAGTAQATIGSRSG